MDLRFSKERDRLLTFIPLTFLFIIIVSISVQLYVMSIFATMGTQLQELQTYKNDLIKENTQLKEEISRAKTLDYAREVLDEEEFEEIDQDKTGFIIVEGEDSGDDYLSER